MTRNFKIKKARDAGKNLSEIALEYGISTERVRQICKDPGPKKLGRPKKAGISPETLKAARCQIDRMIMALDQIAHHFEIEGGKVRAVKVRAIKVRLEKLQI